MVAVDRRHVMLGLASLPLALSVRDARAAAKARLVIVGGGAGGATVAVSVKRAVPEMAVTLIEPQARYTSCFHSNHFIGGFIPFERITHDYEGLAKLGIDIIPQRAAAVDAESRQVVTDGGQTLAYDRLVVAPGIGFKFDAIEGYDEAAREAMPHAWSGGQQSLLLRARLEAMEDGGLVVIAAPRNPYRCPPGPYERACLIANYLQRAKPRSKVVILDAKMAFSKQAVFEEAFERYYKDTIELRLTNDLDDMGVARVDAKAGEVVTRSGEVFKAAVANIVPDQTAGGIALAAGLADGDWCPVEFETFRSARLADIYVVGDAAIAPDMPKSAYSASNQARAVAGHVLADLAGRARPPAAYRNTCWSTLAPDDSVKIGADYAPGEVRGQRLLVAKNAFISQTGESAALRKEAYEESLAWFETLADDMFARAPAATGRLPNGNRG